MSPIGRTDDRGLRLNRTFMELKSEELKEQEAELEVLIEPLWN